MRGPLAGAPENPCDLRQEPDADMRLVDDDMRIVDDVPPLLDPLPFSERDKWGQH